MKKALKILGGLIFALVLYDAWRIYLYVPSGRSSWDSTSPDGRFTVSVYYNPGIFFPLPPALQPRGRVGTVVLRENRTGKVLQRERSEIADASGEPGVTWIPQTNRVSIISIGGWDLPPEEPGK